MIIDTNILIAFLSAEPNVATTLSGWKRTGQGLFISSISVAEVLAFPQLTESEFYKLKIFFKNFISVPFDDEIAEKAALIRRRYNFDIPDAAIAATALFRDVPLVTRDRQFRRIKEITIIEI